MNDERAPLRDTELPAQAGRSWGLHEVTKLAEKTTRAKGEVHKGVKSSGGQERKE